MIFEFKNIVGIFWPFYGPEVEAERVKMCCSHHPLSI